VIRLRFVQEYRGRRIVTNVKLYGIQGKLITDCRYLDVSGARAAMNSKVGIEECRKYFEWHERRAAEYPGGECARPAARPGLSSVMANDA
jgi:hypothetical protein